MMERQEILALAETATLPSLMARAAAVRGAIAGSHPIWGRYSRFEFPNWAAKFFVDAVSSYGRARRGTAFGEDAPCV